MQSEMPQTVAEIIDQFVEYRIVLNKVSPLTIKREKIQTDRIKGYLGHYLLNKLTSVKIEKAYVQMKKDGLSDSELHKTHVKLKQILRKAVNDGLINRNPCDAIIGITKPKQDADKRKAGHLTAQSRRGICRRSCLSKSRMGVLLQLGLLLLQEWAEARFWGFSGRMLILIIKSSILGINTAQKRF